jgi:hypothetical protein
VFVECDPQPIRFQYLMRRRADFSHEAYLKRYEEIHSQFFVDRPNSVMFTSDEVIRL